MVKLVATELAGVVLAMLAGSLAPCVPAPALTTPPLEWLVTLRYHDARSHSLWRLLGGFGVPLSRRDADQPGKDATNPVSKLDWSQAMILKKLFCPILFPLLGF